MTDFWPAAFFFGCTQTSSNLLSDSDFFATRPPIAPDEIVVLTADGHHCSTRPREQLPAPAILGTSFNQVNLTLHCDPDAISSRQTCSDL